MVVTTIIAGSLIAVFISLALVHIYWLLGGEAGKHAAIPEVDGKPMFQPSASVTLVVAIALVLCAVLIAATAGMLTVPLPQNVLMWLTWALAILLLLRAIGDFRLVGFWKRIRDTRFAYLDTTVYSPLCLVMAIGSAFIGFATQA